MPTSTSMAFTNGIAGDMHASQYSGTSWAPTSNSFSGYGNGSSALSITGNYSSPNYITSFGGFRFATSGLPSNATITSATLSITKTTTSSISSSNKYFVGDWGTYDANTAYPQGGAVGTQSGLGSTGQVATTTTTTMTLVNAPSFINKFGNTDLRIWLVPADAVLGSSYGTSPGTTNTNRWDYLTTSIVLTVYYNVPSTTTVNLAGTLGLAGTLTRSVAGFKAFAGTLGLAGTIQRVQPTVRNVGGVLGLAGALTQGIGRYAQLDAVAKVFLKYSGAVKVYNKYFARAKVRPK